MPLPTKFLAKVAKDPRVDWISDEREEGDDVADLDGDGIWIMLKKGFICTDTDTHAVHEWTPEGVRMAMLTVEPCNCPECRGDVP